MRTLFAIGMITVLVAQVACRAPDRLSARTGDSDARLRGDSGVGLLAECHATAECGGEGYCDYTPGLCGKGSRSGGCIARPESCSQEYAPVCGCDGRVYSNECRAHAAGVALFAGGGCKQRIPDWAPCGPRYCNVQTSYCEIFLSDVFELPTDYFCRPLPPSCRSGDAVAPTCACFPEGTRCGSFCGPLPTADGATSGFHLTCQGRRAPTE